MRGVVIVRNKKNVRSVSDMRGKTNMMGVLSVLIVGSVVGVLWPVSNYDSEGEDNNFTI